MHDTGLNEKPGLIKSIPNMISPGILKALNKCYFFLKRLNAASVNPPTPKSTHDIGSGTTLFNTILSNA
jgi:hypothetical protein